MIRKIITFTALCFLPAIPGTTGAQQIAPKKRPNILMLVADDMNWDTPGCFGGAAPGITPNIDRLAEQGMRFKHAYVNVSICIPSRSVMLSGLYSQNNGAEGFQRIKPGTPTLPSLLNQAGYLCGIIGKPLRQQELFRWSVTYRWQGTGDENRWGRDPAIFRRFAKKFFAMARNSNQPFFLMANSHDPHRPFGGDRSTKPPNERAPATRTFSANEVKIPAFLPDLPGVRSDLAAYCTSVRRLDDMVREVLEALKLADFEEETLVIFLADHGMPFPGAKFNCYVDSMRSPFIIRWPGKVKPGSMDTAHMVTTLDLMPTILEIAGVPSPKSDGRSFVPLLLGEKQADRDAVFTQFFHIHGRDALPMRSVLTREAAYVFNPWSNGERRFDRLGGGAYGAMQQAARTDPKMAARVSYLELRAVEEFFDLRSDPGCLKNLIGTDDGNQPLVSELRARLRNWMVQVNDPALAAFEARDNPAALEAFIESYRAQAQKEVDALKPYEKAQNFRF